MRTSRDFFATQILQIYWDQSSQLVVSSNFVRWITKLKERELRLKMLVAFPISWMDHLQLESFAWLLLVTINRQYGLLPTTTRINLFQFS